MVADINGTNGYPTILIVPGSFSPPPFYAGIVQQLAYHGFETLVVHYPSIGRRDPLPPATMADDAAYTSAIAETLADAGKSIVMVTHSYGGIVGTESTKGLAKTEREAVGKIGGIIRLLYITSLVPRVGESLQTLLGSGVVSFLRIEEDYMSHEIQGSSKINFSDLPVSEALEWAKLMPEHSTISFSGELTHAGYKNIPVSYLLCEADIVVAPMVQQSMIDMMTNEAGVDVDIHTINSGHCPNVSMPKTVGQIIAKVAGQKV